MSVKQDLGKFLEKESGQRQLVTASLLDVSAPFSESLSDESSQTLTHELRRCHKFNMYTSLTLGAIGVMGVYSKVLQNVGRSKTIAGLTALVAGGVISVTSSSLLVQHCESMVFSRADSGFSKEYFRRLASLNPEHPDLPKLLKKFSDQTEWEELIQKEKSRQLIADKPFSTTAFFGKSSSDAAKLEAVRLPNWLVEYYTRKKNILAERNSGKNNGNTEKSNSEENLRIEEFANETDNDKSSFSSSSASASLSVSSSAASAASSSSSASSSSFSFLPSFLRASPEQEQFLNAMESAQMSFTREDRRNDISQQNLAKCYQTVLGSTIGFMLLTYGVTNYGMRKLIPPNYNITPRFRILGSVFAALLSARLLGPSSFTRCHDAMLLDAPNSPVAYAVAKRLYDINPQHSMLKKANFSIKTFPLRNTQEPQNSNSNSNDNFRDETAYDSRDGELIDDLPEDDSSNRRR